MRLSQYFLDVYVLFGELFSGKLIPVCKQRQKDCPHVFRCDRYQISRFEPLDQLAFCHVRSGNALMMDYGSAEITKVAPEIVARVLPEELFNNLIVPLVRIKIAFSNYILASEIVIPKIVEGDEAKLAKGCEVGAIARVSRPHSP